MNINGQFHQFQNGREENFIDNGKLYIRPLPHLFLFNMNSKANIPSPP